jgi:hypothetical protein
LKNLEERNCFVEWAVVTGRKQENSVEYFCEKFDIRKSKQCLYFVERKRVGRLIWKESWKSLVTETVVIDL